VKPRVQIALIAGIAVIVTVLHYMIDPHAGAVHDILQRIYYLPVVLGGLWFGLRGGILTAVLISIVYFPHAYHGWHGPQSLFFRMSEITMYHVIGGLTGILSSRLKAALMAEKRERNERETAYEGLRHKTEELFALEEQLRRSERLAALGRLSAGLAHEIRNPLSSIQTSLELLQEQHQRTQAAPARGTGVQVARTDQTGASVAGDAGDDPPDFHAILLEETDRLNRILSNFLEFARAEVSKESDEPPITPLADAVIKTIDLLEPQCRKRNVMIEADSAALNHSVAVRESHLRQVFLNLFLNAIEAMPGGGTIRVGDVKRVDDSLSLTVDDTGPGISASHAQKIFDPFFSTKSNGTGLGLSIVERILSAHGGSIRLDTTHLPSSQFRITLPVGEGEE